MERSRSRVPRSRQHFRFRISRPQRVFTLNSGDCLDSMCATDRLCPCFRKTEVFHLACLHQVLHRSGHLLYWYIRINTVLIKQINDIRPEPPQRFLSHPLDVLWLAIQTTRTRSRIGINIESELVAITTWLRKGARASPTSSSLTNGP